MPDRAAPEGQNPPQTEVEATPKMIEAGVQVLDGYRPVYDGLRATVSEIYRAMQKAGP
jgi:hypothetical protein